jgi:hypothetical protein
VYGSDTDAALFKAKPSSPLASTLPARDGPKPLSTSFLRYENSFSVMFPCGESGRVKRFLFDTCSAVYMVDYSSGQLISTELFDDKIFAQSSS